MDYSLLLVKVDTSNQGKSGNLTIMPALVCRMNKGEGTKYELVTTDKADLSWHNAFNHRFVSEDQDKRASGDKGEEELSYNSRSRLN